MGSIETYDKASSILSTQEFCSLKTCNPGYCQALDELLVTECLEIFYCCESFCTHLPPPPHHDHIQLHDSIWAAMQFKKQGSSFMHFLIKSVLAKMLRVKSTAISSGRRDRDRDRDRDLILNASYKTM